MTFRCLLAVLALAISRCLAKAADQPNIVFIFSDDHALQAISAYGSRLQNVAPLMLAPSSRTRPHS